MVLLVKNITENLKREGYSDLRKTRYHCSWGVTCRASFDLSTACQEDGELEFANPRNAAAGTSVSWDTAVAAKLYSAILYQEASPTRDSQEKGLRAS